MVLCLYLQYFGFVFLLIGVIILYRMWTGDHPYPYLLAVFGCLILAAGVLSLMLREQWFLRLDPTTKVPVYSLLGVAVCFSLLFSLFDVCQSCISACWSSESVRPLISTTAQIYLLVATSCAMGVCFGYAFGVMDIEDEEISHLKAALDREDESVERATATGGRTAQLSRRSFVCLTLSLHPPPPLMCPFIQCVLSHRRLHRCDLRGGPSTAAWLLRAECGL